MDICFGLEHFVHDSFLHVSLPEGLSSLKLCKIYLLNLNSFHFVLTQNLRARDIFISPNDNEEELLKKFRGEIHEIIIIFFQKFIAFLGH